MADRGLRSANCCQGLPGGYILTETIVLLALSARMCRDGSQAIGRKELQVNGINSMVPVVLCIRLTESAGDDKQRVIVVRFHMYRLFARGGSCG